MINVNLHNIVEFAAQHHQLLHDFLNNSSPIVRNDLAEHGISSDVIFYKSSQHLFAVTSTGRIAVIA